MHRLLENAMSFNVRDLSIRGSQYLCHAGTMSTLMYGTFMSLYDLKLRSLLNPCDISLAGLVPPVTFPRRF